MIENISNNSGVSPAADLTQKAASAKTLCHTPFGDVMVDELSTPNLAAIFSGGRPDAKSASAAAQPVVVAPAAQAAVAASTAQAAVATTSTVQSAVAASTVQAATGGDPAQNSAPTAESVFGSSPWLADPTGTAPDGSSYSYNPLYFATTETADQVAQMVGGKVVASDQLASAGTPFVQQQPNQMVELANGTLINPGLVASFYTHGYPQSYIDTLIQNETQGA
jgi:hypothetical protein